MGLAETIFRRLRLMVSSVRVLSVDDSGPLQTLRIEGFIGEIRDNVPRVGQYGFSSVPPRDSEAVAVSRLADRSQLAVVAVEDHDSRPKNQPVGSAQIYSENARVRVLQDGTVEILGTELSITIDGDISIGASGEVSLTAPTVRLGPLTEIDGIAFSTHSHAAPGSPPVGPPVP